jgi:serine/threonine-protein kinase
MVLGDFGSGANRAVEVPAVVGMDEGAARDVLGQAGFSAKIMPKEYDNKFPAGQVMIQNPEAGMSVKRGKPVRLYISLGPANFVMPDVAGEHIDKVPALLKKAGFRLNSVQRFYSKQFPAGRVIGQNPKKGSEYNSEGVGVDLVVADSTGLPKLTMPDLCGKPLANAEELLTRREFNLRLGLVEYVADDINPAGAIVTQEPQAGKEVPLGAKVSLTVAAPTSFMQQKQRTLN